MRVKKSCACRKCYSCWFTMIESKFVFVFYLNFICLCSKLCTKIDLRHLASLCVVLSKQSCQDLKWTSTWMLFFPIFSPSRQLLADCTLKDDCKHSYDRAEFCQHVTEFTFKTILSWKNGQRNRVSGQLWLKKKKKVSTVSMRHLNCGTIIKALSSNCMTFITMSLQQRWSSQPPEGEKWMFCLCLCVTVSAVALLYLFRWLLFAKN